MVAMENAQNKALAVKNKTTGETPALIIGADTIVVIDGSILPKPANRDEAVAMLQRLSGRTHQVITAIAVAPYPTGEMLSDIETTMVKFRRLTKDEILGYADSGEPLDKAGAYGIQGLGVFLVDGITGDYPNVVGLPVRKLYEMLRKFNVDIFRLSLRQKAGTEVNVI